MASSDVATRIRACARRADGDAAADGVRRKYGDGINKTLYHLTSAMSPDELDQVSDNEGNYSPFGDSFEGDDWNEPFDFSPGHVAGSGELGRFSRRCSKRHLADDESYGSDPDESFEPRIKSNRNMTSDLPEVISALANIDELWMNEMSFDGDQFPSEPFDDVSNSSDESDRNQLYERRLDTIVEEGSDELDSSVPDMSVDGVPWWKLYGRDDESATSSECSDESNPRTPPGEATEEPFRDGVRPSRLENGTEEPANVGQPVGSREQDSDSRPATSSTELATDRTEAVDDEHTQPAAGDDRLNRKQRILPSIEAKKLYFEANLCGQTEPPIVSNFEASPNPKLASSNEKGQREKDYQPSLRQNVEFGNALQTDDLRDTKRIPRTDVRAEDDISEVMPERELDYSENENDFPSESRVDISQAGRSVRARDTSANRENQRKDEVKIDGSRVGSENGTKSGRPQQDNWRQTIEEVTSNGGSFVEKTEDLSGSQPQQSNSCLGDLSSWCNRGGVDAECNDSLRDDCADVDMSRGRKDDGGELCKSHSNTALVTDAPRAAKGQDTSAKPMTNTGKYNANKKDDLKKDYTFKVYRNNMFTFTVPKNSDDDHLQMDFRRAENGKSISGRYVDSLTPSTRKPSDNDECNVNRSASANPRQPGSVSLTNHARGSKGADFRIADCNFRVFDVDDANDDEDDDDNDADDDGGFKGHGATSEMEHRSNQSDIGNSGSCSRNSWRNNRTADYQPATEQIAAVSRDEKTPIKHAQEVGGENKLDDGSKLEPTRKSRSVFGRTRPDRNAPENTRTQLRSGRGIPLSKQPDMTSSDTTTSKHAGVVDVEDGVWNGARTCTALATSTALVRRAIEPGSEDQDVATVVSAVARAEVSANNPYIAVARASARAASVATASATKRLTSCDAVTGGGDLMNVIISTSCMIRGSDADIREESSAILDAVDDYQQSSVHRLPVAKALTDAATQFSDDRNSVAGNGAPTRKAKLKVTVENPEGVDGHPKEIRTLECDWPTSGSEAEVTSVMRDALRQILDGGAGNRDLAAGGASSRCLAHNAAREDQARLNKRSISVSTSLDADEGVVAKRKIAARDAISTPDTGIDVAGRPRLVTSYVAKAISSSEHWQLSSHRDQTADDGNSTQMDPTEPSDPAAEIKGRVMTDERSSSNRLPMTDSVDKGTQDDQVATGLSNAKKDKKKKNSGSRAKNKKSSKKIKGILKNSDQVKIDRDVDLRASAGGHLSTPAPLIPHKNKITPADCDPTASGATGDRGAEGRPGTSCQVASDNGQELGKPAPRGSIFDEPGGGGGRSRTVARACDSETRAPGDGGAARAAYSSVLQTPVSAGEVSTKTTHQYERPAYGRTARRNAKSKADYIGEAASGRPRKNEQKVGEFSADEVETTAGSSTGLTADSNLTATGGGEGQVQRRQADSGQGYSRQEERRQVGLGPEGRRGDQSEQEDRGKERRIEEDLISDDCGRKERLQDKRGQDDRGQERRGRDGWRQEKRGQAEKRKPSFVLIDINIEEGRKEGPDIEELKTRLLRAKPKPPPAPYADSAWNASQLLAAGSRERALNVDCDPDDPYGIYGTLSGGAGESREAIRKSRSLGILPSQLPVTESGDPGGGGSAILDTSPDGADQSDSMSVFYVTDLDNVDDKSRSMSALSAGSDVSGNDAHRNDKRSRIPDSGTHAGDLSECELRISRSLSKLSIPDWFTASPRRDQEIVILRNANPRNRDARHPDRRSWHVTSASPRSPKAPPDSPGPVVIHNWISSPYRASSAPRSRTPSPSPGSGQTFELPSSRLRSRSRERPKPVPIKALHDIRIPSAEGAKSRPAKEAYLRLRERSGSRDPEREAEETMPDLSNYFENRAKNCGTRTGDDPKTDPAAADPQRSHGELQHRQSRSRMPYSEKKSESAAWTKRPKEIPVQTPAGDHPSRADGCSTSDIGGGECLPKDSGLGSSSSSSPRACDENSNQIRTPASRIYEEPVYVNVPYPARDSNNASLTQKQNFSSDAGAYKDKGTSKANDCLRQDSGILTPGSGFSTDPERFENGDQIELTHDSCEDRVLNGEHLTSSCDGGIQKTRTEDSCKPWYEEDEGHASEDNALYSQSMDILSFDESPGSRRHRKKELDEVPSSTTNQGELTTEKTKKAMKSSGKVRNKTKNPPFETSNSTNSKDNGSFENLLDGLLVLDSPPNSMIGQKKKNPSMTSLTSQPMAERLERALQLLRHPLDSRWESGNEEDSSPKFRRAVDDQEEAPLGRGKSEIIVKCRNKKCRKAVTLDEARKTYKTCHNCYTYYCSRDCRREHWTRHKRSCPYSRISSTCKRVARLAHDSPELCAEYTRIARAGYLSRGRGCVLLTFACVAEAELFIAAGGAASAAPAYASIGDLRTVETMGEHLFRLTDMCRSYNPELKYVLDVAIAAGGGDGQSGRAAPKRECRVVQLCYKLRLSTAPPAQLPASGPDADTLILTAVPGSEFSENLSGRKAREICFVNIQRKLRQRGVSLRHQHPEVYARLCAYVADNEHFTPIAIFPMDTTTGRKFMCLIMPDAEPEVDWIERSDLLEQLGLSTAV